MRNLDAPAVWVSIVRASSAGCLVLSGCQSYRKARLCLDTQQAQCLIHGMTCFDSRETARTTRMGPSRLDLLAVDQFMRQQSHAGPPGGLLSFHACDAGGWKRMHCCPEAQKWACSGCHRSGWGCLWSSEARCGTMWLCCEGVWTRLLLISGYDHVLRYSRRLRFELSMCWAKRVCNSSMVPGMVYRVATDPQHGLGTNAGLAAIAGIMWELQRCLAPQCCVSCHGSYTLSVTKCCQHHHPAPEVCQVTPACAPET